ncbi:MAG: DUF397 domain-containing protein [Acidobacteria bacterium]|nr:DUF397 domain-containing protein [Acidobacteriota bacterium]
MRERLEIAVTAQQGSPLWKKSTASGTGNCVEVAITADVILVRDSKRPELVLTFPSTEWKSFLASAAIIHPV